MLYAWIDENGTLCTTFELASVPEKYRSNVVVFEDFNIHDWDKLYIDENGEIKVKSEEQILVEKKRMLLESLKQKVFSMLSQTDWVLTKCSELGVNPNDLYPDVMSQRRRIRGLNDELEEKIKEAKTLQELEEIEQEIMRLGG
ncbi:MAG: hypothetical protein QW607_12155 [Desulfurococcaceae archaeon]